MLVPAAIIFSSISADSVVGARVQMILVRPIHCDCNRHAAKEKIANAGSENYRSRTTQGGLC